MAHVSKRCCHLEESLVALGQELRARLLRRLSRKHDRLTVEPLNCMLKRWAVDFLENVTANLDYVVWSYRQEESIEGRMMQST